MSAAPHAIMPAPYPFDLSASLSTNEQQMIIDLLALLPDNFMADGSLFTAQKANETAKKAATASKANSNEGASIIIRKLVDGRGLACPMPLLKTKVALRDIAKGEALYVIATDPNSQADITAFCRQSQASSATSLAILVNTVTDNAIINDKTAQAVDTIFHFIITKTDSN